MQTRNLLEVAAFGASLDWLTVSALPTEKDAQEFHFFCRDYMAREQERMGPKEKSIVRGYSGIKVGDTQYVHRHSDGHRMIIASGERSNRLAEEIIVHGITGKITRIDAQVLAECGAPEFRYPELVRDAVSRAREERKEKKRKRMALFDNQLGNDGVTIGSRASETYIRVYDYEAKHGTCATGTRWRHEIEFKGERARLFFEAYKTSASRPEFVAGTVKRHLDTLGIPCEWMGDLHVNEELVGRKIGSDEKSLLWLKNICFPLMVKLAKNGRTDDLKELVKSHELDKIFKVR